MTSRIAPPLIALLVLAGFGWTLRFLYKKSTEKPVTFSTVVAQRGTICRKTIAPGAIVPRREVAIKPRVSGVIEKLFVQPGDSVNEGTVIAKIKIIPNVVNLNSAEARLSSARINLESFEKEYDRSKSLSNLQLVDQNVVAKSELDFNLAKQEVDAADKNLQLVREGFARGTTKVSNVVTSTVAGMITEVPVKEGGSVIESNTFNEGTTVASVADMSDMVFLGHVDESEVGKLKRDMPVNISVGALDRERFSGMLEYISPKGTDKDGTIEFEIRAHVELKADAFIRANYGANAEIVLEQRDNVLSIPEGIVEFEKGASYVEVAVNPVTFEKRPVELGLSDGFSIEVLSGIAATDRLKVLANSNGAPPPPKPGAKIR